MVVTLEVCCHRTLQYLIHCDAMPSSSFTFGVVVAFTSIFFIFYKYIVVVYFAHNILKLFFKCLFYIDIYENRSSHVNLFLLFIDQIDMNPKLGYVVSKK